MIWIILGVILFVITTKAVISGPEFAHRNKADKVLDVILVFLGVILITTLMLMASVGLTTKFASQDYESYEIINITPIHNDSNDALLCLEYDADDGIWYYRYTNADTSSSHTVMADYLYMSYTDNSESPRIEKQEAVWQNPNLTFWFTAGIKPTTAPRYIVYVPEGISNIVEHEIRTILQG